MKKLFEYLKKEKIALIVELIIVIIGMFLALYFENNLEESKEQKRVEVNLTKNLADVTESYIDIYNQMAVDQNAIALVHDTELENIEQMQNLIDGTISSYEFKQIPNILNQVAKPIIIKIDLDTYNNISMLQLYKMSASYLHDLDISGELLNRLNVMIEINENIELYYSFREDYLNIELEDIKKDAFNNIEHFKTSLPAYSYLNTDVGKEELDVDSYFYRNMIFTRINLISELNLSFQIMHEQATGIMTIIEDNSVLLGIEITETEGENINPEN